MVFVFQSVYFAEVGIDLDKIFLNSALSVIFSLLVVNLWSKVSDKTDQKKKFIVIGNVFRLIAFAFLPIVRDVPSMFVYTIILNSGPNPDSIFISYVYKISDYINPKQQNERPIYHKISTYTEIRKFGSVGWACMLPFAGLIIDTLGFKWNFLFSASLLGIMTLIFALKFDESLVKNLAPADEDRIDQHDDLNSNNPILNLGTKSDETAESVESVDESPYDVGSSLWKNIKWILRNEMYKIFIVVSFIAAIAGSMSTTIFSIFNNQFSNDSYILLSLTWSVNAFIEYPIMNLVSDKVEKYGWQRVIIFTYFLGMIRFLLNPLLLLFDGTIIWIYLFQIINGINFGLSWPATTYGLNVNLDKDQKSLGMTFYNSMKLAGNFTGNMIGSLIALMITDSDMFYNTLYVLAASISLIAALILYKKSKERNWQN